MPSKSFAKIALLPMKVMPREAQDIDASPKTNRPTAFPVHAAVCTSLKLLVTSDGQLVCVVDNIRCRIYQLMQELVDGRAGVAFVDRAPHPTEARAGSL